MIETKHLNNGWPEYQTLDFSVIQMFALQIPTILLVTIQLPDFLPAIQVTIQFKHIFTERLMYLVLHHILKTIFRFSSACGGCTTVTRWSLPTTCDASWRRRIVIVTMTTQSSRQPRSFNRSLKCYSLKSIFRYIFIWIANNILLGDQFPRKNSRWHNSIYNMYVTPLPVFPVQFQ